MKPKVDGDPEKLLDGWRGTVQDVSPPATLDHLPPKLLRCKVVEDRTGLSRSTIWRLERRGAFPRRIRVSANIVAWLENEVAAWIQAKAERVPQSPYLSDSLPPCECPVSDTAGLASREP